MTDVSRSSTALFCILVAIAPARASDPMPVNPAVTQDSIGDTICQTGWTRTIRPLVPAMKEIKDDLLRLAGEPPGNRDL